MFDFDQKLILELYWVYLFREQIEERVYQI